MEKPKLNNKDAFEIKFIYVKLLWVCKTVTYMCSSYFFFRMDD